MKCDAVRPLRYAIALSAGATIVLSFSACHDSGGGGRKSSTAQVAFHEDILLLDRLGFPIEVDSDEPYSPRQTCGECHWVDYIANGYHFQQGRTDGAGAMHVEDDYFGKGADYVRSDGMYGKW